MENVSFLAFVAFVLIASKALVAFVVAAGLAVVFGVLEVSGGAGVDTDVVEDDISFLASVANVFFGGAGDALGVGAGNAGGDGEESLVESGAAVFDTGELGAEGEGVLTLDALFGDGAGAVLTVRINAFNAGLVFD